MQCSALYRVQCTALYREQCIAVHFSAVQWQIVVCNEMQCTTERGSLAQSAMETAGDAIPANFCLSVLFFFGCKHGGKIADV